MSCICSAAKENAPADLRLGFFPNITHSQALYARGTGIFEKETGLKIAWTSFNAGPSAIEALFSDAIDATYVGPSPTINGYIRSHGSKFVIVAGAASGGAALVIRGDSPISNDRDFANKTVATPQLGNTQDVAARVWLAEKGYKLKERGGNVNLVPLSNADQLTMFKTKQIDAAWTIEPWVSRLELEGKGRVLLEEKTLWPEGRYVTTHLVVTRRYLEKHPDSVRKLLAAHVMVTQIINSNKAAAIPILNAQLKKDTTKALKPEVINRAMDRVELTWDPIAPSLRKAAESAHTIHFIRKEPDLRGIYDLNLLNTVLAGSGLRAVKE